AEEIDVVRPVVAAAAAALHRTDLREAALPESQHVLRHVEIVSHFADGAEGIGRLVHDRPRLTVKKPAAFGLPLAARLVVVDALLEARRWLEHHHTARRDRHLGAGLRIAADTLALLAHHERAEG